MIAKQKSTVSFLLELEITSTIDTGEYQCLATKKGFEEVSKEIKNKFTELERIEIANNLREIAKQIEDGKPGNNTLMYQPWVLKRTNSISIGTDVEDLKQFIQTCGNCSCDKEYSDYDEDNWTDRDMED